MKDDISISTLSDVVCKMLSYLGELEHDPVRIEWDKYWDIKLPSERYGDQEPHSGTPDVSWLSDDWDTIQRIKEDPKNHMNNLVEASNLLRAVGDYLPRLLAVRAARDLVDALEGLRKEEKQELKQSIEDIVGDTPQTAVAATRFKRYVTQAGKAAAGGLRSILIDVVSETVKKLLWP